MSVRQDALITAWSFSRWETYVLCPFKFKCKFMDKLPTPQTPSMARGNQVHLDLKSYVTGETQTMPDVVVLPFQRTLVDQIRAFDDKLVEQQWGFDHNWRETGWFDRGPVKTWFRSILDVALLYEDLVAEVIDWKTGKVYGENAEQMELFALSLMCKFKPATHVITRLVYLDAKAEQIAEYPAADKEALQAKWERKVEPMFNDRDFIPRPNDKCRFCDFSKSKGGPCRFG
jgi:hypothetical protein